MNDVQTREYNAAVGGQTVLDNNAIIWNGKAAIVNKKGELDDSIDRLDDLHDVQEMDRTGTTVAKQNAKRTAGTSAWMVAKVMRVFAHDNNNMTLLEEIDFELSDLIFEKDSVTKERWQTVHDRANTHILALVAGGYGITALQLTGLQGEIDAFELLEGEPIAGRAAKKAATTDIVSEIKILREVKEDMVDLLAQFALSNTTFYNSTLDAFEINDAGIRHQAARIVYLDDATGVRLQKVTTSLSGGAAPIEKLSSLVGVVTFMQQEAPQGNYTLDSTKAGYVAQQRTNLGFETDKLLRLEIRMVKV